MCVYSVYACVHKQMYCFTATEQSTASSDLSDPQI